MAKVDGVVIGETVISADTAPENWLDVQFDLSPYAGQDVNLELLNQGEGKMWENGYWASIEVRAAS